jgi:multidrug resistance efflux pump
MLIILAAYVLVAWLVFVRLRLLRWGWVSGGVTVLVGAGILAVFLALFNSLTPSGSFVVVGRVIEVTPNVSGAIVEVSATPDTPVKKDAVLFRIDPAPFAAKVRQLEAALVQAEQQAEQLKAGYVQATATVEGLAAQLAYNQKRLSDIRKLTTQEAMSLFREQDSQVQVETVSAQLQAARAAQTSAKLALDAQIGGTNSMVAQTRAQLDDARWQLEQTVVRAPGDGQVSTMALGVGDRALQARSVLSFVLSDETRIVGLFPPSGFRTVAPGAAVKLVFHDDPGRIYHAKVEAIPRGVGQGQIAVSGQLARVGSIGGVNRYPVRISVPAEIPNDRLRLGMPGDATVFSDKAGVIGLIMSILVWVQSYTAYL